MHSNFILDLDPNNTWRLVLWKQILVDHFPGNIFGIGFGTPAVAYYPVADFSKLDTLPYVLGAHNSYIYLFGRLGIVYLLLIVPVHVIIFKEYFYHKSYYRNNNGILLFYSFFAISMITLFNPTLESPIFAAGYWLVLGFLARCIYFRQLLSKLKPEGENLIYS
jgi:O-antigen ligase